MAWPLLARLLPWGAAANVAVQLARLGVEYKTERDRLKVVSRGKDVAALAARLEAMESRFDAQVRMMEELAQGLEREVGRMRRALMGAYVVAGVALLGVAGLGLAVGLG